MKDFLLRLKWTHGMRLMGIAILVHETLRPGGLAERPTLVIGAFGLVGLHEVVKRDRGDKQSEEDKS